MDDQSFAVSVPSLTNQRNEFLSTSNETATEALKVSMSCEEMVRLAATQYVRGSPSGRTVESWLASPALGAEEQKGIELANLLIFSAECISNTNYDQAARLLTRLCSISSQWGNPIERLCYYFTGALQERIQRQERSHLRNPLKPSPNFAYTFNNGYDKTEFNQVMAFYYSVMPFVQISQLTSVQAIIDNVGNSSKIHVIDLDIRNGCKWSGLMESLAARRRSFPIMLLRITAIGLDGDELKDSGRRLHDIAESLEIPFSYRMVQVKSMEEIHETMFNVKPEEAVAVVASTVFHRLLYNKILLERVVDVIKRLRPKIMVNIDVEADSNASSFDNRFVDLLFHCSACFDSFDVIMPDRRDLRRVKFEEMLCGCRIRNIIACEGSERRVRHVKIDVWRRFFKHKGLREMSFSYQAWHQARLLLKEFPNAECYSLEANGDALITGWKTTPIVAVSLWTCT